MIFENTNTTRNYRFGKSAGGPGSPGGPGDGVDGAGAISRTSACEARGIGDGDSSSDGASDAETAETSGKTKSPQYCLKEMTMREAVQENAWPPRFPDWAQQCG